MPRNSIWRSFSHNKTGSEQEPDGAWRTRSSQTGALFGVGLLVAIFISRLRVAFIPTTIVAQVRH